MAPTEKLYIGERVWEATYFIIVITNQQTNDCYFIHLMAESMRKLFSREESNEKMKIIIGDGGATDPKHTQTETATTESPRTEQN